MLIAAARRFVLRHPFLLLIGIIAVFTHASQVCYGELKLPSVFGRGMIFQQQKPLRVWGSASSGSVVQVELRRDGNAVSSSEAKSDANGNWLLELGPRAASFDPHSLVIRSGKDRIQIDDILIGELWLASGQSNMHLPVQFIIGRDQLLAGANNAHIRCFGQDYMLPEYSQSPLKDNPGGAWVVADSGKNLLQRDISGIGYTFALALFDALNRDGRHTPVGIINAATGSTSIHAWISREACMAEPSLAQRYPKDWAKVQKDLNQPTAQFNQKIAPLTNMNIRGVIWSQGENDASHADYYRVAQRVLISDWRKQFRDPTMPFIAAQLAPYAFSCEAALFRQAQIDGCADATHAVALPIHDVSLAWDEGPFKYKAPIHPLDKTPVGRRMALAARAMAYGEKIEYLGPRLERAEVVESKVILHFGHIANGLAIGEDGSTLNGFEMCGDDGKYHPADAQIAGDTVIVTCPAVARPASVQFAFSNVNHDANLVNSLKEPADPFRCRLVAPK